MDGGRLESADEESSRRIKRVTGDEMMERWDAEGFGEEKIAVSAIANRKGRTTGSCADRFQYFGVKRGRCDQDYLKKHMFKERP